MNLATYRNFLQSKQIIILGNKNNEETGIFFLSLSLEIVVFRIAWLVLA